MSFRAEEDLVPFLLVCGYPWPSDPFVRIKPASKCYFHTQSGARTLSPSSRAARAGGSGGQIPSPASLLLVLPQPSKATGGVGVPRWAPLPRGWDAKRAAREVSSGVAAHGGERSGVAELGKGVAAEALAHGFGLRVEPGRVLEAGARLGQGDAGEGTRGGHGAASPARRCCFGSGRV